MVLFLYGIYSLSNNDKFQEKVEVDDRFSRMHLCIIKCHYKAKMFVTIVIRLRRYIINIKRANLEK